MKTIFEQYIHEIEINKSRFIGIVFHLEDKEDFKDILKNVNKLYPKATHYCYAYSIGQIKKSNDDGEPSGTAGMPILNTIIDNDIDNVGVIVVRYFGGIKLGAGGLTRAYRQSANEAIKNANITEVIKTQKYKLEYDYSLNSVVNKYINQKQIHEIKTNYDINVIKEIATNNNLDDLFDLCNGKITIKTDGFIDLYK